METKGLLFGSIGLERARHVFLTAVDEGTYGRDVEGVGISG